MKCKCYSCEKKKECTKIEIETKKVFVCIDCEFDLTCKSFD